MFKNPSALRLPSGHIAGTPCALTPAPQAHRTSKSQTARGREILRALDYPLIAAVVVTYFIGVAAIYSAAGGSAGLGKYYAGRQLIWGALSLPSFAVVLRIPLEYILRRSYCLWGLCCLLLLLLFLLGTRAKGAQSWFSLGFVRIQPAEFAKLGLAFLLARQLTLHPPLTLPNFIQPLLLGGLTALLILLQPDLGGTLVYCAMIFIALLVAGSPKRYLISLTGGALALLPLAWMLLKDYQKKRVLVFINPELDPLGAGYNVIQSRIAVGSGHFWGKGFMQGTQSKLRFLPEPHTDFIFSVIAEEFGLVGCVLLLLLFAFILWRMIRIALTSRSLTAKILISTLSAWLWFHCVESIGMSMGLLPVTGLPLPFVSYGGSSLLAELLAIAVTLKIGAEDQLARRESAPSADATKFGFSRS